MSENLSAAENASAPSLSQLLNSSDFAAVTDPRQLPQPAALPIQRATHKICPEHFIVNEQLDIEFSGEGEHLWVFIQKTGMNTVHAAKLLADWAGIPERDVGYSGLKDRQAVTTQWFSLRIPNRTLPEVAFNPSLANDTVLNEQNESAAVAIKTADETTTQQEQIAVLEQHWHNKKLSRGAHKANQFILTLTEVQADDQAAVEARLQQITQDGVPNYFGGQRFGHGGNNISEALKWFHDEALKAASSIDKVPANSANHSEDKLGKRGNRKKERKISKRLREQHSMRLSAARSLIFNRILATRVADNTWNSGLVGEVFNLAGTGSIFASDTLDATLLERVQAQDIHPTAPLWGLDNDKVIGEARELEEQIIASEPVLTRLAQGLEAQQIKAQRRALRLVPQELAWQWLDEASLQLQFSLPTGSYATSVLYSLVEQLNSHQ
ncbi:tRNA pseudouridine(13) synthase TruD [Psychrobacter arenosus]|uniref:tRNA pseudouridine(13) synthase TruD n=1 Tax=Psychrobacter arenosus TaxID=256326 RepID=UPI0019195C14|nr:tRNA pseudouridine(13) synthase TruD [Psychrobacter arenosus]